MPGGGELGKQPTRPVTKTTGRPTSRSLTPRCRPDQLPPAPSFSLSSHRLHLPASFRRRWLMYYVYYLFVLAKFFVVCLPTVSPRCAASSTPPRLCFALGSRLRLSFWHAQDTCIVVTCNVGVQFSEHYFPASHFMFILWRSKSEQLLQFAAEHLCTIGHGVSQTNSQQSVEAVDDNSCVFPGLAKCLGL